MKINLEQAAEICGTSVPTLRKTIASDSHFPVGQRGGRGKAWVLDAAEVARYWYVDRAGGRPPVPEGKSAAERKAEAEAALAELKVREAMGDLIEREPVFHVMASAFAKLGARLERFPNATGKELNWAAEEIELVRERLDQMRRDFARDVKEYLDPVEPAADSEKKPEDDAA